MARRGRLSLLADCELYMNFLDVTAAVEPEADIWLVRLTRPPLHIVLAMTGAAEDSYRVS